MCPWAQSMGSCHGMSQTLQLLRNKCPQFQLLQHMFPKFRKHIANDFLCNSYCNSSGFQNKHVSRVSCPSFGAVRVNKIVTGISSTYCKLKHMKRSRAGPFEKRGEGSPNSMESGIAEQAVSLFMQREPSAYSRVHPC